MPQSNRMVPHAADIRTRTQPERDPIAMAEMAQEPAEMSVDKRHLLDTLSELSPLPPALAKSQTPSDLPASLATAITHAEPSAVPVTTERIVDRAVSRAEIKTVGLAETNPKPIELEVVKKPVVDPVAPPVTIDPAPEVKPTVAEPLKPELVWRNSLQTLRAIANDPLKSVEKGVKPGAPNWMVREKLLAWLAEPDVDPDASSAEIAQGRAVLKGLEAVLDPSRSPEIRGAEIREAVATLEAQTPLEISELKLCRMVNGFGNIEPLEPIARKPGQSVVLYCELEGLVYEPVATGFRSRVSAQVELMAESSESPVWTHVLGTAEDTCRRRRRDFFVGHKFTLPDSLAPGNYRLRLTEKDLVTNHVATRITPLAITK